jgi:hypothetical protein
MVITRGYYHKESAALIHRRILKCQIYLKTKCKILFIWLKIVYIYMYPSGPPGWGGGRGQIAPGPHLNKAPT